MQVHRIHKTLLPVFLVCVTAAKAQYHTQVGLGNYGAVHSFYINPSLNAYSAYNWQINLAGIWANVNNNYLTLRLPYSIYRAPNSIPSQYLTESGNPRFDKNWLTEQLNGRPKFVSASSDFYGPAFTFKSKSWHIGLFTYAASNVRLNRVSEAFAHAAFQEFDSASGAFKLFGSEPKIDPFNASGNARAGLGINVAKSVQLDWKRQVLIGASVKKVWGFQGFHFNTDGLAYEQVNDHTISVLPTQIQLVDYGQKIGQGWGVDLGATYVFHKKDFKRHGQYAKMHTKYFAKIGFSIMDIGSIRYKDATIRQLSITSPVTIDMDSVSYSGNSDYAQAVTDFLSDYGNLSVSKSNYTVGLPTRLVMSGDFQLRKNVFVAGIIQQSLRDKDSRHARYQNYLMVSPRLEYRLFEVSVLMLLEYDYRAFRMGASVRLGPLYVGTNSLMTFVNTRAVRDADIFIGIAFGNLSEFSFRKQARAKLLKTKKGKSSCFSF
jgi:hypothetical protein